MGSHRLSPSRTAACYVTAVITGLVSSLGVLLLAGVLSGQVPETLRREAWDVGSYWLIGLPLCYLVAGMLGWLGPERIWRWPLAMMATQGIVMLLFSRNDFSLLPLGVILLGTLALPGILTAWIGRCAKRCREAMAASS
jgi:hypothetical protein